MHAIGPKFRFVAAVLVALAVGCSSQSGVSSPDADSSDSTDRPHNARQSVTLQLNWFPEAEHGGYYAALVHGYYADAGLDVTITPGGPNVPVVQSLAVGRIDFAVTNADRVLLGQQAGADVVALMAPIQNTPRCIMVHEESGIQSLHDLRDVTLAIGTGPAFYQFMQKRLPLENVETIAYPGSIGPFVANKQFAQQAYVFSEPFLAQRQGAKPVPLMLSEIGYNPYASLLVTRRQTIDQREDLVKRIVRASVRGWQQYLSDPAKTNEHIHSLNPDMELPALEYGVEQIRKLSGTDESGTLDCQMTRTRWQQLIDQLSEINLISPDKVSADIVFDARFVADQ